MIKKFLSYVEIMTKITSFFAFLMTIAFLLYKKYPIDPRLTSIFFASMFLFDLTTTAINNYMDTKTNDQVLQFDRRTAKVIIFLLLAVSTALGVWLVYLTDLLVLLLGGLCFLCGIFYTYGPVPISRQPLGEIFSGVFYGFFIPFILFYINTPPGTLLNLTVSLQTVDLTVQVVPLLTVLLLSVAPVCATANIMLANNICDMEKDILVKRFTLPYYLGDTALRLFAGFYYLAYVSMIVLVVFRILPPLFLLSLLTLLPVQKNIHAFFRKQEKSTTFIYSVKNYILIMGANSFIIFLCAGFGL